MMEGNLLGEEIWKLLQKANPDRPEEIWKAIGQAIVKHIQDKAVVTVKVTTPSGSGAGEGKIQ